MSTCLGIRRISRPFYCKVSGINYYKLVLGNYSLHHLLVRRMLGRIQTLQPSSRD